MTESEIIAILAEYQAARSAILVGGQSYTINTNGSIRTVTLADLELIEKQIQIYSQMLNEAKGNAGFQIKPGW